jgi:hypothetical protein
MPSLHQEVRYRLGQLAECRFSRSDNVTSTVPLLSVRFLIGPEQRREGRTFADTYDREQCSR